MNDGFDAVLFDMDGLLLDTERLQLNCFVETRRKFNLADRPDVFLTCIGLRSDKSAHIVRDSLTDEIDYDAFCKQWKDACNAALAKGVPLRPGVLPLVRNLAGRGMPMGIATSTKTNDAKHHLEGAGILQYFDHVIGGDMVDDPKPNPQIYMNLAKALKVDASTCVAFEDSETGTRAAIASGATTIQVPDLIPPSDDIRKMNHIIAPSLLEGALVVGLIDKPDFAALKINQFG